MVLIKIKAFDFSYIPSIQALREMIQNCRKQSHVQQVAFSTYHDSLTQICFGCKIVRSGLNVASWEVED